MSQDEFGMLFLSGLLAFFLWIRFYLVEMIRQPGVRNWAAPLVNVTPPLCAGVLLLILMTLAANDVTGEPVYLTFYMVLGAAWIGVVSTVLPYFGLDPRQDVAERQNRAAAVAIAGALLGLTLCFAGGNIGNGPGWWVVVISAALATVSAFALWAVIEWAIDISERVTVERDLGASIRFAALFTAIGLILGRAAAGDWVSLEATVSDFWRVGWPSLTLTVLAIIIERVVSRTSLAQGRKHLAALSAFPMLVYLGLAGWYVFVRLPRP